MVGDEDGDDNIISAHCASEGRGRAHSFLGILSSTILSRWEPTTRLGEGDSGQMQQRLSGRRLLTGAASLALRGMRVGSSHSAPLRPPAESVIFQEIPPETSGLTCSHEDAMSAEHYPPEALGPVCAFLDYD